MNSLPLEKQNDVLAHLRRGVSIRQTARLTGVNKNTVMYYRDEGTRRYQRRSPNGSVCCAVGNPERLAVWGEPIPEGMRLGWTCEVPYCSKREHMALVENKNFGRRSYAEIRNRLNALKEDEAIDLASEATDERSVCKLRSALQFNTPHFILRTLPSGGVRLIRTGDWYEDKHLWQEKFPVLMHAVAAPVNGLRSGGFFLGFMSANSLHRRDVPQTVICKVKACVFPANGNGQGLCHRHYHFAEYAAGFRQSKLDKRDVIAYGGEPQPTFTSGWMWQEPYLYKQTKFEYRGELNHGARESDKWWKEQVEAAYTSLHRPLSPGENAQHTGAFILWKGFGKKKIRKSQRNRPAGWHGNHPSQMPVKKFERESIAELPVWTPQPHQQFKEASAVSYEMVEEEKTDEEREQEIISTMDDATYWHNVFENGVYD